jgi:DNA-directed RNA polymerase subunit RPC12/RpoP
MGAQKKTAAYKIISDASGNRYKFYCEVSDALACTTEPIRAKTPEEELQIAWETVGRKHFNLCHKCGRWVIDAVYNADVWECVECAPYEAEPNFCKNCGIKIEKPAGKCPACGHKLVYEGEEIEK